MVFSSAPAHDYRANGPLPEPWESPQSSRLIVSQALVLPGSFPNRYCRWPGYSGPRHRALGPV